MKKSVVSKGKLGFVLAVFIIWIAIPGWSSSGWITEGGGYQRTGQSEGAGPELGTVKWSFRTDGPIAGSAVVDEEGRVYIACEDANLYCVDPNGVELWCCPMGNKLLSSPTVDANGVVYVGAEDCNLYAVQEGVVQWSFATEGFVGACPAVGADGTVYCGSTDGVLYAVEPNGVERWRFEFPRGGEVIQRSIVAGPAIGLDGTVYVGGLYDPNLYAVNPGDGSLKWVCSLEHVVYKDFYLNTQIPHDPNTNYYVEKNGFFDSPVVASDGTIYAFMMYDSFLQAIDPNTGTVLWCSDMLDRGSYGFIGEIPYRYVTNRPNPELFGAFFLDDYTDSTMWSRPAIGIDGTLYVTFDDPFLRAVDPNGEIQWTMPLGNTGGFTMATGADGLVYAACDDGSISVVDVNSSEVARFNGENRLEFPVIGDDGTLYVSDANHVVWAIEPWAGEPTVNVDLHHPGDVDMDGVVMASDIAWITEDWLDCTAPNSDDCLDENLNHYSGEFGYRPGDINRDFFVDLQDVAQLGEYWMGE